MKDLWFIHYTVIIPTPKGLPPRTSELVAGPYEGWEAVTERQKLLRGDSVVDAFLDRAPQAKPSAPIPVHSYRATGASS